MSPHSTDTQTSEPAMASHRPQPPAAAPRMPAQAPAAAPAPAPAAPASDASVPVELIVRDTPDAAQAAPAERPQAQQRTGIPAGPLLLSLTNGAGLAGTGAYYAAGMTGAVVLGSAVAAAGAAATAVAARNGRRYGSYGLRGWGRGYGRGGYGRGRGGGYGGGSGRGGLRSAFGSVGGRRASGTGAGGATGTTRTTLPKTRRSGGAGGAGGRSEAPRSGTGVFSPGSSSQGPQKPSHRRSRRGLLGRAGAVFGGGRNGSGGGTFSGRTGRGSAGGSAGAASGARSRSLAGRTIGAARARVVRTAKAGGGMLKRARDGFPGQMRQFGQAAARRWKKGAKGRRLWRQRLRMTRRISGTAVLSVLGAVLGQLAWPFRFHAARTWKRIWNWRALRAQKREDRIDARHAAKDAATERPPVADKVNAPQQRDTGKSAPAGAGSSTGGTGMQVFARAAEQVATAYSRYSPPSMMSVAAEYDGVPDGIRHAAQAIAHLVKNTRDVYPAHVAVAERVSAVYMKLMQAAETADEISPHFRRVHQADLERHEAPRNGWSGEVMWNIGGRAGDQGGQQTSVFARSAEQVATVYTRWTPAVMTDVAAEYESLPTGIEHLAQAVNSLAIQSADSYPVDPSVGEMVAAVRHRLTAAVSTAQEIMPLFRRVHQADLDRHEAPRNGAAAEAMWNV